MAKGVAFICLYEGKKAKILCSMTIFSNCVFDWN